MKSNCGYPETIVIIKEDGTMALPGMGLVHTEGLYVHYTELPDRLYRVKNSIMGMADQSCLWKKYGYTEDKSKSYYVNSCHFINDIAPKYLIELHEELKKRGNWTYDDDEDWNFDFKVGENVVCINNDDYLAFKIGATYTIQHIDTIHNIARVGDFLVSFFDCIEMFGHVPSTDDSERYDFTKMKPFTPVLARDGEHSTWLPHFFESFHPQNLSPFRMIDTKSCDYRQCVPYEGNEDLLNTQNPIPDYYRVKR
jgi:hypothetical protein